MLLTQPSHGDGAFFDLSRTKGKDRGHLAVTVLTNLVVDLLVPRIKLDPQARVAQGLDDLGGVCVGV